MGMRVTALDSSKEMIEIAKKLAKQRSLKIRFVNRPAEKMKLKGFDFVLSITVLQHILDEKKRKQAIINMVKATKIGGKIIILEKVRTEPFKEFHVKPWPEKKWVAAFESAGAVFIESSAVDVSPFFNWLNKIALAYKYRKLANEYPGIRPVEENAPHLSVQIYRFILYVITKLSKPIDYWFANIFKNHSRHLLMVFERRK
jgi:ubiquinone/menaquinone biosynthesis C-methylase UbiE